MKERMTEVKQMMQEEKLSKREITYGKSMYRNTGIKEEICSRRPLTPLTIFFLQTRFD